MKKYMKKKILALILSAVVSSSALVGCSNAEVEKTCDQETEDLESMFVEVGKADISRIVYDRETKVMYAISDSRYNRGSFTLLVDENGNPKLWDGE